MAREKLQTQIRQEQIARAALKIVARDGLHGLNVAAVAKEVGIVPSAIYRHVEGRAGVVDAALGLVGEGLRTNVDAVRKLTHDPLERLRLLLDRHLVFLMENPGIPRLVFSEEVSSDPQRRRAMYGSIRSYLGAVAELVREAQASGQIRAGLDADTVSRMFLGLIQPAVILWQLSDGEFDLMEHGMQAWEVLVVALVETESRPAKAG
ncbi:MAG: TetR/AcrR family transcriptional regulator [Deferrisomatales bacterium]|nr:TetR/AcrR family transcriptional regulator [Deferrisomatales bacterium]